MKPSLAKDLAHRGKGRLLPALATAAALFTLSVPAADATSPAADSARSSQPRPAVHWGGFVKNMCFKDAYRFSNSALKETGFREFGRPNNHTVIAGNDSVVVQVSYAPSRISSPHTFSSVYFAVTAVSPDSGAAERARNNVRTRIVKKQYFDTC
ncbi:hypothetical protein [Rhizohabitans arisaemae]|uniref:hypothetical protein n=1 Tax=Rhizohabitans arisaemae TaxID=2720610 RepID=UPI0024B0E15F|nr:hypothetical protein [Rhizohabitans arisaemae]